MLSMLSGCLHADSYVPCLAAVVYTKPPLPAFSSCVFTPVHSATDGTDVCRANVNSTQFDAVSGLDGAAAAVQPPPGPLAGEQAAEQPAEVQAVF